VESHDHHFKNVFLDFPTEALAWLAPEAFEALGPLKGLEFVRQEPRKRKLKDAHPALDMPILFNFEEGQVLLWLVEFQEDKGRFSIYRLLRYATDLMEAYPRATVIPTVLFTRRGKWRKDVTREIGSRLVNRVYLHFEYQLVRLFDFNAKDYYENQNPIVKILMPRMNYTPEERPEVIRQAYMGLYQLATPMLFDKYVDFIDVYAGVRDKEREELYRAIAEKEETAMLAQYIKEKGFNEGMEKGIQRGKEETAMLAQYIKEKGFNEGMEKGIQQGIQQGMEQGIQQGVVDGLLEGIELGIGLRFGAEGLKLMAAVRQIREVARLKAVKEAVKNARDLEDFRQKIPGTQY